MDVTFLKPSGDDPKVRCVKQKLKIEETLKQGLIIYSQGEVTFFKL